MTAGDHNADMSASGTLIAEGISRDKPLVEVAIQVRRISRADLGDESAEQPLTWTLIEFEVEDQVVANLAKALSRSLDPSGGWYCDFRTDAESFVVFAGRAFRYPRGEAEARAEAAAYGRSVGVPELQLDWPV